MKIELEAICGRRFSVEREGDYSENPELLCRLCGRSNCDAYFDYLYFITHHNNPE